jgi:hypothetical protein
MPDLFRFARNLSRSQSFKAFFIDQPSRAAKSATTMRKSHHFALGAREEFRSDDSRSGNSIGDLTLGPLSAPGAIPRRAARNNGDRRLSASVRRCDPSASVQPGLRRRRRFHSVQRSGREGGLLARRDRPCADNCPDMRAAQRRGQPARHESVDDLHALKVARGRHDLE